MEPHDGIEPTPSVWKTEVLPLYECDIGWEGRGRTYDTQSQSLLPCHLATSQWWPRRDLNPRMYAWKAYELNRFSTRPWWTSRELNSEPLPYQDTALTYWARRPWCEMWELNSHSWFHRPVNYHCSNLTIMMAGSDWNRTVVNRLIADRSTIELRTLIWWGIWVSNSARQCQ